MISSSSATLNLAGSPTKLSDETVQDVNRLQIRMHSMDIEASPLAKISEEFGEHEDKSYLKMFSEIGPQESQRSGHFGDTSSVKTTPIFPSC